MSHVVPDLSYLVSLLAQVSLKSLDWEHVRKLNLVVRTLKKMSQDGQAEIVLPRLHGKEVTVVTPFDASYAKEPGLKNQAGFMSFLTTGDVALPFQELSRALWRVSLHHSRRPWIGSCT